MYVFKNSHVRTIQFLVNKRGQLKGGLRAPFEKLISFTVKDLIKQGNEINRNKHTNSNNVLILGTTPNPPALSLGYQILHSKLTFSICL